MYPKCNRECWYPQGFDHGWRLIHCPLPFGHKGIHADENCYPFFDEKDIEWYNTQHEVYLSLGWVE